MLAGCTDNPGGGEGSGEEIVRFSVVNEDEVDRAIEIEIQENGEAVASGRGTMPKASEQTTPFRYAFPGVGVPVTAVVTSDNGGRSLEWDPAECAELQVDVVVVDGEPQIEETCQ